MKKAFLFAATAMMLAGLCACNNDKDNGKDDGKKEAKTAIEITTAADNLVMYLPLESAEKAVAKGDGVTFAEAKGAGAFGAGQYHNGYYNTTGDNMQQAYLKFNLASDNLFKHLDDMTFTCWVKLSEDCSKGAMLSVNGSNNDWPAFIVYFDNTQVVEEVKEQQVNGRLTMYDENGEEKNLWLATYDKALAKYDTWFQFAFTYKASTGEWNLYVDGIAVKEEPAVFGDKLPVKTLVSEKCNAMYVGAWASFVEGASTQDWQSYFAGAIDEVRIFNKALTADEIVALRREELAAILAD